MCRKTKHIDNVFENFDITCQNRKGAKRASGGIALLTKKCITPYVNIIENVDGMISGNNYDDFIMWFNVDSKLVNNGMLLGVVYFPPQNSQYSSIEMFVRVFILLIYRMHCVYDICNILPVPCMWFLVNK